MLNENMYAVAVAIGEVIVKNFPIELLTSLLCKFRLIIYKHIGRLIRPAKQMTCKLG